MPFYELLVPSIHYVGAQILGHGIGRIQLEGLLKETLGGTPVLVHDGARLFHQRVDQDCPKRGIAFAQLVRASQDLDPLFEALLGAQLLTLRQQAIGFLGPLDAEAGQFLQLRQLRVARKLLPGCLQQIEGARVFP